ncbi:hypothetical protein ACCC92_03030 [Mucilaginibacter sp. Mucisp84]|uniref:hypothetical protein n=1 Tax=Mucilaginibacter sp. Mucisp84 TaxID=3243058 RepID=UPI0039A4307E
MEEQIPPHILAHVMTCAAEMGAIAGLISAGKLKPYLSKSQAFRRYGRARVERWLAKDLIAPRKDGNHSAQWRIDRLEIACLEKAEYLLRIL